MMVFGKERDYVVHDVKNVKGFFGDYRFLSNYHVCPVYFEGQLFGSTEAAYQAAKTEDLNIRSSFICLSPNDSKKMGNQIIVRNGWNSMKYDVMSSVLFDKFYRNQDLREALLATENKYLEETNHWGDIYWGVCDGKGESNLGKLLMAIREFWKIKTKGKLF